MTEAERAMLEYARKLTTRLAEISPQDVHTLRDKGFTDSAILEINAAAAYMNFVNRVAEGLGVELEPGLEKFTR